MTKPAKPAPLKDRIHGSSKNRPGSASAPNAEIQLAPSTEKSLRKKARESGYSYGTLASVWRRGAGAYSTSHRPGVPRSAWAMARVNKFIEGGVPQDDDLRKDRKKKAKKKEVKAAKKKTLLITSF